MFFVDHPSCSLSLFSHTAKLTAHTSVAIKSCCNFIGWGSTSHEPMGTQDRSVDCWPWWNYSVTESSWYANACALTQHTHRGQMRGSGTCLAYRAGRSVSKKKRHWKKGEGNVTSLLLLLIAWLCVSRCVRSVFCLLCLLLFSFFSHQPLLIDFSVSASISLLPLLLFLYFSPLFLFLPPNCLLSEPKSSPLLLHHSPPSFLHSH